MYNGIGLTTPRGSGTNGYVQRNMSFVNKSREKVNYKTEDDIKMLDALANRKPNQGILAHEKKRTIELKCLEMQELMEEQGYPDDVIDSKVALFREMLLAKDGVGEKEISKDEFGRPIIKESHQLAEANQEKNSKMRNALGISPYFVEGSSLDPERRNKEAAAAAAEQSKKQYVLIPDSSSSSPEKSQEKEKEKKRKKKKSPSNRERGEPSPKKKKSVKKHKKERSASLDVPKKKKSKKTGKEKSKYKSKGEGTRKKQQAPSSASSSDSSSDSSDEDSSSKSRSRDSKSDSDTSQDKHKSSSKHEKAHKSQRKRSTSSERIRYAKDARSRKDIYEAKKAKYKKKSRSSSSSSSGDSPPKQYYRLEPVLVKSKSKHKISHPIFEIPKKSALELMKYERKKRRHDSSSSSEEEGSKRRKRSESPTPSKSSKHRAGRDERSASNKYTDSHKSSKRFDKRSSEKHHRNRSRSAGSGSQHKSQSYKYRSSQEEYSDDNQRQKKERPREDERQYEKKSRKKHSRKDTDSQTQQNGYSKYSARSRTSDSEYSNKSESVHKHKKYIPRSPSHSPVVYKHKKHVASPSYMPSDSDRKKIVVRSPSCSPPKKQPSKYHRAHQSSPDLSPHKKPNTHDSVSRSRSPLKISHHDKENKVKKSTSRVSAKSVQSPARSRDGSMSRSRSPSMPKNSNGRTKHRTSHTDRSPSTTSLSDKNGNRYHEGEEVSRGWKSKGEVKEIRYRTPTSSPESYKEHSRQKKDKVLTEYSASPQNQTLNSKPKPNMTVTVETCQITTSKTSLNPNHWRRNSSSQSPDRVPSMEELRKLKKSRNQVKPNPKTKNSPVHSRGGYTSKVSDRSKHMTDEDQSLGKQVCETKFKGSEVSNTGTGLDCANDVHTKEDSFTAKKSNWSLVSAGGNSNALLGNKNTGAKQQSSSWCEEDTGPNSKDNECLKLVQESVAKSPAVKGRRKKSEFNPSRNRSPTQNVERGKSSKYKEKTVLSRSRSRSTSVAHSCSPNASERSSRSRSYSHRDSKSRSRSKSYSKSRSRSHSRSRSKSRSRSHSKSYSRSVSIDSRSHSRSYSSRSRSRSIARSPSIPRRRGSPSFLDKRRITS